MRVVRSVPVVFVPVMFGTCIFDESNYRYSHCGNHMLKVFPNGISEESSMMTSSLHNLLKDGECAFGLLLQFLKTRAEGMLSKNKQQRKLGRERERALGACCVREQGREAAKPKKQASGHLSCRRKRLARQLPAQSISGWVRARGIHRVARYRRRSTIQSPVRPSVPQQLCERATQSDACAR